jgi:hypothetical protein
MAVDPDILIVIATLVAIFAFSTCVKGWVNREWPWVAMISLGIGLGLLAYVHLALRPGGLTPRAIPDAFIHVLAMVLG